MFIYSIPMILPKKYDSPALFIREQGDGLVWIIEKYTFYPVRYPLYTSCYIQNVIKLVI